MKKLATIILVSFTIVASAQSELEEIQKTLMNYINGSSYNDADLIQSAFYSEADLYLSKKDQEIWVLNPKEYADLFQNRTKGEFNGREGKVLTIDYAENIASAKAEIRIPSRDLLYVDIFLLKKIAGEWKIISKAAAQIKS
ncbi:nuclear transport factor 2 family protein [Croceivirga thetidis]|uniref:Nuclear transport factor 2 family protein n=1 Tax=Croceivirga thetidis TaxID=2721623 RepID=A0ABX1GMC5_9FLAO|nr:nuclear transport factor 2 family protein [Croceivirga thetidis]NKI31070.1 nuclear transport factor 2 family protein [Croceivirga thetidis]